VPKCPCGGKRKVVRYVTDPEKIREGVERLGVVERSAGGGEGAQEGLGTAFGDIAALAVHCRYRACRHDERTRTQAERV
jgi:hypothetical protein